MHWYQFSILGPSNKYFPTAVLETFLPDFLRINKERFTRWHFLFEPALLVRFQSENANLVYTSAKEIAHEYKFKIIKGDASFSSPINIENYIYPGEAAIYGEEVWEALANVLQANSELALQIIKEPSETQVKLMEKCVHLFCNSNGCHYGEEAVLLQHRAKKARKAYLKERQQ